ncbi:MAG: class I SAM-dependent methyltransferase [Pseudomonadota bacterium]
MLSRENPSQRYMDLLASYKQMHAKGYEQTFGDGRRRKVEAKNAFSGDQLPKYIPHIKQLVAKTGARSIIDYGAGKGSHYGIVEIKDPAGKVLATSLADFWGIETITLYDPGVPDYDVLPTGTHDGLISTDVLEHIPRADAPWVVEEMFSLAEKFVFANVACYPAVTRLPDGSNAHETVQHPQWWAGLFEATAAKFPEVDYMLSCVGPETGADGSIRRGQATFHRWPN